MNVGGRACRAAKDATRVYLSGNELVSKVARLTGSGQFKCSIGWMKMDAGITDG
jgi:hypothetical protein